MGKRFLGRACDSGMAAGHLCLIRVRKIDYIGPSIGIEPTDFGEVWYPGRVIEVGTPTGNRRPPIRARFATKKIRDHKDPLIARFHNLEPPFAYEVKPLYRMLGRKREGLLNVGDRCQIVIGDFHSDQALCRRISGLTPGAIRAMFSPRLQGTWEGRILQGGMTDVVAAVLTDERLRAHPDTAKWIGHEPGMRYFVKPLDDAMRARTTEKASTPPPRADSPGSTSPLSQQARDALRRLGEDLKGGIWGNDDIPEA